MIHFCRGTVASHPACGIDTGPDPANEGRTTVLAEATCGACIRAEIAGRALVRDTARAIERRRSSFLKKFR